ncbi:hypothetical protein VTN49DRAFT_3535 [Thermomyces lanuginosus]|uniref:uncharacterized protein n=1 Tax=Thermomyces lanuginosus TaxID=5541 RepID=UPI003742B734
MASKCVLSDPFALSTALYNILRTGSTIQSAPSRPFTRPSTCLIRLRSCQNAPTRYSSFSTSLRSAAQSAGSASKPESDSILDELVSSHNDQNSSPSKPEVKSTPHERDSENAQKSSGVKSSSDKSKSQSSAKSSKADEPKQKKKKEPWQIQKEALKRKFKEGWNPPKKLSPDAMEGIRHLHAMNPEQFTTPVLAEQFKVSPEAIRRILKSKWRPSEEEMEDRRRRWEKRQWRIWDHMAELGLRPKRPGAKSPLDED